MITAIIHSLLRSISYRSAAKLPTVTSGMSPYRCHDHIGRFPVKSHIRYPFGWQGDCSTRAAAWQYSGAHPERFLDHVPISQQKMSVWANLWIRNRTWRTKQITGGIVYTGILSKGTYTLIHLSVIMKNNIWAGVYSLQDKAVRRKFAQLWNELHY